MPPPPAIPSFCCACRYDVTGLRADSALRVRCPECGHHAVPDRGFARQRYSVPHILAVVAACVSNTATGAVMAGTIALAIGLNAFGASLTEAAIVVVPLVCAATVAALCLRATARARAICSVAILAHAAAMVLVLALAAAQYISIASRLSQLLYVALPLINSLLSIVALALQRARPIP